MKILVHICCSIDSHYHLARLREAYPAAQIIGYFYDPNIHPIEEFVLRYIDVARSCRRLGIALLRAPYDDAAWLARCGSLAQEPERGRRCDVCFDVRLARSAAAALALGADALATTLACSPKKDLEQLGRSALRVIKLAQVLPREEIIDVQHAPSVRLYEALLAEAAAGAAGEKAAKKLEFLNPDFRQNGGTQRQLAEAKAAQLYHQNYCGCMFALAASRGALVSELFGSAARELLPNSPAQRLAVFAALEAAERRGEGALVRKNKALNYRLLFARAVQNRQPVAAAVLFYSHFTARRAVINLNSLAVERAAELGWQGGAAGAEGAGGAEAAEALAFLKQRAANYTGELADHPLLFRANKDQIIVLQIGVLKDFWAQICDGEDGGGLEQVREELGDALAKHLDGGRKDCPSAAAQWLRQAPSVQAQIRLRTLINPGALYDLSPVILLDELGGKLEITALSEIFADACTELV